MANNDDVPVTIDDDAEAPGERALDTGYAQLAEEFHAESRRAERRIARDRRACRAEARPVNRGVRSQRLPEPPAV